jgi:hypothetical protein
MKEVADTKVSGQNGRQLRDTDCVPGACSIVLIVQTITPYLSGILHNKCIEGWDTVLDVPYHTPSDLDYLIKLCEAYDMIAIGARDADSEEFSIVAMAPPHVAFKRTDEDTPAALQAGSETNDHNGVSWYCWQECSMGYCRTGDSVKLLCADIENTHAEDRLSWELTGDGGWRAGATTNLGIFTTQPRWHKVILGYSQRICV